MGSGNKNAVHTPSSLFVKRSGSMAPSHHFQSVKNLASGEVKFTRGINLFKKGRKTGQVKEAKLPMPLNFLNHRSKSRDAKA